MMILRTFDGWMDGWMDGYLPDAHEESLGMR